MVITLHLYLHPSLVISVVNDQKAEAKALYNSDLKPLMENYITEHTEMTSSLG